MIRPFDWRDVGVVQHLAEAGLCLDAEIGLIHGHQPLPGALLEYLVPGAGTPTLVWRAKNQTAFGQLRHPPHQTHARLLYVAPVGQPAAPVWLPLLEQLAQLAGQRGAQNLIAEVDEVCAEYDLLRAAGFAIYARQSLWKLQQPVASPQLANLTLRPTTPVDTINLSALYANLVPRLVQQVEAAPRYRRGYVLERTGELIAFLDLRRGPLGTWVEPFLHPEAYPLSEAVIHACLSSLAKDSTRPVYFCVRRYQDWLQDILAEVGFQSIASQTVMVKRLTARVMEPVLKPLPDLKGKAPTPVIRTRLVEDTRFEEQTPQTR